MASEAKVVFVDDSEPVDLDALDPAERAFIQAGLDDLDNGRWVDHSVIRADIAAMRAEVEAERAAKRVEHETR
jgi:hypothetical protein